MVIVAFDCGIAFVEEPAACFVVVPRGGGGGGTEGGEGLHPIRVVIRVSAAVRLITGDFFGFAVGLILGDGDVVMAVGIRLIDVGAAAAVIVGEFGFVGGGIGDGFDGIDGIGDVFCNAGSGSRICDFFGAVEGIVGVGGGSEDCGVISKQFGRSGEFACGVGLDLLGIIGQGGGFGPVAAACEIRFIDGGWCGAGGVGPGLQAIEGGVAFACGGVGGAGDDDLVDAAVHGDGRTAAGRGGHHGLADGAGDLIDGFVGDVVAIEVENGFILLASGVVKVEGINAVRIGDAGEFVLGVVVGGGAAALLDGEGAPGVIILGDDAFEQIGAIAIGFGDFEAGGVAFVLVTTAWGQVAEGFFHFAVAVVVGGLAGGDGVVIGYGSEDLDGAHTDIGRGAAGERGGACGVEEVAGGGVRRGDQVSGLGGAVGLGGDGALEIGGAGAELIASGGCAAP